MEEAVKEKGEERPKAWEALPSVPNPSLAFLGLSGTRKEAEKAASAFSCRAFYVEEAEGKEQEGEGGFSLSFLSGGGQVISLKKPKEAPLSHLLFPLLPEEASLAVFDPGRVEIKGELYSMSSCYITDLGSREVLKNFSLLKQAGKKAIDLSWIKSEQWRERAKASLLSMSPSFFEIETGSLDALALILAGWGREEFGLPARFIQAPSYSSSVCSLTFGGPGWQRSVKETDAGKAFEIGDGERTFKTPKRVLDRGDLLIRQMELLPPDPLYFKCLDFEAQGAKDVG